MAVAQLLVAAGAAIDATNRVSTCVSVTLIHSLAVAINIANIHLGLWNLSISSVASSLVCRITNLWLVIRLGGLV